jgi:hypothetical protein
MGLEPTIGFRHPGGLTQAVFQMNGEKLLN